MLIVSAFVDYARTLREWRARFADRYESDIVPALKAAYPELKSRHDIEVFRRKWLCQSSNFFLPTV